MAEPGSPAKVLIVGGGVALETLMALRDLAGDRVGVTLVAPEPDFVYEREAAAVPGPEPEGLADVEVPLDPAARAPARR
jgi:NADH dehydrogenase FAD-containing subunit